MEPWHSLRLKTFCTWLGRRFRKIVWSTIGMEDRQLCGENGSGAIRKENYDLQPTVLDEQTSIQDGTVCLSQWRWKRFVSEFFVNGLFFDCLIRWKCSTTIAYDGSKPWPFDDPVYSYINSATHFYRLLSLFTSNLTHLIKLMLIFRKTSLAGKYSGVLNFLNKTFSRLKVWQQDVTWILIIYWLMWCDPYLSMNYVNKVSSCCLGLEKIFWWAFI